MSIQKGINEVCLNESMELPRSVIDERHWVIAEAEDLIRICRWARDNKYNLCTMVAMDERLRAERKFKLYYILSAPLGINELVILEYPLSDPNQINYPSIREIYPAVCPLEKEIKDMFGLNAQSANVKPFEGFVLHNSVYPVDLHPLRRTRQLAKIRREIQEWEEARPVKTMDTSESLPQGMSIVPVGPIHAGIIEAGYFPLHVAGEIIEELPLQLGWKHRGIEKLFETHYTLENGWELAEKISGDSSFAHSLAYCQAIENITGIIAPEAAWYWRCLLLELERMYNHINDVGLLALGMAYNRMASKIGVLREGMVQLNQRLGGHRLLRGINRPGGVVLSPSIDFEGVRQIIEAIVGEFIDCGRHLIEKPECRDRMRTTGKLTREESQDATGLVARATGLTDYDFRLRHPHIPYCNPTVREILRATVSPLNPEDTIRRASVNEHDLSGDVLARLTIRVAETEASWEMVKFFLGRLITTDEKIPLLTPLKERIHDAPKMEIGLGYAEGARGVVFYFIVKGMANTIYRCKICDPSLVNWHIFPKAVVRKQKTVNPKEYWENTLGDFPLINKSFNLSYAGHDL